MTGADRDSHGSSGSDLNILLVSHGLPPESVGGVEQHVEGLATQLVASGHRVHVYTRSGRAGEQGTRVEERGRAFDVTRVVYRYEGLDSLGSLYRCPTLDRSFEEFLGERAFDVAHVHHFTGLSTGVLDVLQRRGIPVVVTLHDYWLMCPRGQMWHRRGELCEQVEPERCADCLAPTFGGWLPEGQRHQLVADVHREARQLLDRADALVLPSPRALPPYQALGLEAARFRIVENGVDTHGLEAVPLPARPAGAPLRVGYLGTLIPSKGLDVLVTALQSLPAGTARLDVWGNAVPYHGDDGFLTRVFGRLRPGDQVTYHGPYHTAELARILASVDVVVAPALWREAFGLTVREALAAGRPVVVSRVGGLQDAVEDGREGLVVEPGDAAGLTQALARLAGDASLLQQMAAAARGRARGFAPMTAELVDLYREVAALAPPDSAR